MSDRPAPVVIHGPAWARGKLALAIGVLAAIVIGWGLYAWGGARAGHDALAAARSELALRTTILQRDLEIRRLERQVAEFEVLKSGLARERQEVARNIGELQAEVARQKQQLEFYRGIVVQGTERVDVAIRDLRIVRVSTRDTYGIRISLQQPGRPQGMVSGAARVVIDGTRAGRAETLKVPETAYNFRYFAALQPEVTLPGGFVPQRVTVELHAPGRTEPVVTQSMVWTVDGGRVDGG